MNNEEEKFFKLKSPLQLGEMTQEELINYIDQLHMVLKSYQQVIDTAIVKNMAVKG